MSQIESLGQAEASPTKRFFVSMLTRDIGLDDAILDLLDNCLDGALRAADGQKVDYTAYKVDIKISKDHFKITDNCGGIPLDIAKNYAFKMGRDIDDDRDDDSETIGMYGVGMKRAIFKMGMEAVVHTKHNDDSYQVAITPEWLSEKEWTALPITHDDKLTFQGTLIDVRELNAGVSQHFGNPSFINELDKAIGEHFTVFLQKGLTIRINEKSVWPTEVRVLTHDEVTLPAPFVHKFTEDGVEVTIMVGLNTGKGIGDIEETFESEREQRTAGWTIFCNDRAVIVGDKTRLTGWGDGVPMFHGQFSRITGIVEFRSTSADKLPVTTTKRALDTSSNIWLKARNVMKDGLRVWVNYTNKWKNTSREDETQYWKTAKLVSINEAVSILNSREVTKKKGGAVEYNPTKKHNLPLPASDKPSSKRIVFSKTLEEIKMVSSLMFDDFNIKPGLVGEECFDRFLRRAQEAKEDEE